MRKLHIDSASARVLSCAAAALTIFLVFTSCGQTDSVSSIPAADETIARSGKQIVGGPTSGKPYSPAIMIGDELYVSGQIAIDPESGEEVNESVEAETAQVMQNIQKYVEMAGFEMSDVVKVTVFLADMNDYSAMNSAYIPFFPENPPARECVAVKEIVRGFRVEISCIAKR